MIEIEFISSVYKSFTLSFLSNNQISHDLACKPLVLFQLFVQLFICKREEFLFNVPKIPSLDYFSKLASLIVMQSIFSLNSSSCIFSKLIKQIKLSLPIPFPVFLNIYRAEISKFKPFLTFSDQKASYPRLDFNYIREIIVVVYSRSNRSSRGYISCLSNYFLDFRLLFGVEFDYIMNL